MTLTHALRRALAVEVCHGNCWRPGTGRSAATGWTMRVEPSTMRAEMT